MPSLHTDTPLAANCAISMHCPSFAGLVGVRLSAGLAAVQTSRVMSVAVRRGAHDVKLELTALLPWEPVYT